MLCLRGLSRHAVSVCLSVCPSVRPSRSYILSKQTNISSNFFTVVFPYQTAWQYSPNGGVECRWGRQKLLFWANIWLHCVVSTLQPASCHQHDAAGPRSRKSWHLSQVVSGRVCWWRETTTKCMTRSFNVTPKTTEEHLIVRSDKSVITNNKRLRSTFCTIEANYWQTRSIARPFCDSRATCYWASAYWRAILM